MITDCELDKIPRHEGNFSLIDKLLGVPLNSCFNRAPKWEETRSCILLDKSDLHTNSLHAGNSIVISPTLNQFLQVHCLLPSI